MLEVTSWAYQLQNVDIDQVVASDTFQLIVMDYSADGSHEGKYTPEQIKRIRQSGKKVLAYLSIGEAENYRSYWKSEWETTPPPWLGPENPDWSNNYKVRYWESQWQDLVFNYLDEIYDQGFDGIYCDIIDAFYYWREENPEQPNADTLMVQFLIRLREHLSSRDGRPFAIVMQNGESIIHEENVTDALRRQLFDSIDGIGVEDVFFNGPLENNNPFRPEKERLPYLREFLEAQKVVLSVDYLTDPSLIEVYLKEAQGEQFVPYNSTRELDTLFPGIGRSNSPFSNDHSFQKLSRPSEGSLYHGVHPGETTGTNHAITSSTLRAYEQLAGKSAAWVYFSQNWFPSSSFPFEKANLIREEGSVPAMRLMLRSQTEQNHAESTDTFDRMLRGELDTHIRKWARDARAFGTALVLEFGTEVNRDWFSWNGTWNGLGVVAGYGNPTVPDGPERFRDVYRHIIRLFREEKTDNVTWIFHVNGFDVPEEPWNRMELYYPGDSWIDWIGVSVYGASTPLENPWISFRVLMDSVYDRLTMQWPDKPIALMEFGITANHSRGTQEDWAEAALADLIQLRWPRLIGFSWWHQNWQNTDVPKQSSLLALQQNTALAEIFQKWVGASENVIGQPLLSKIPNMHTSPITIDPSTMIYDPAGKFAFSWNSRIGARYVVQTTSYLNKSDWKHAETLIAEETTSTFVDQGTLDRSLRFYRVIMTP
jgi:uncharacterized protein (TIGR01370 family)